jgi:fibronectin-binding autotransporter adhesin
VRLEGSLFPWSFGQEADHNWYLKAQAGLLPELPAYAVLPTLGTLLAQQEDDVVHQRLAGARGTERPQCGQPKEPSTAQAGLALADDCRGFWVAASGSSTDLGANPGFTASGSNTGLYMGLDYAAESVGQTVRIGAYLGYVHGNYWTDGTNSTALPGIGEAGIRLDTPLAGWYGSVHWSNGAYAEAVLSGQRNRARLRTSDGFVQELNGGSVTMSAKTGRRYTLDNGWSLEPQLRVIASDVTWHDQTDGNGRSLAFAHGWVNTVRAGLRVEKAITTDGGSLIKPWVTVAVQDTHGEAADSVAVSEPGADGAALALPNHDLGTTARLDAGVEARLGKHVSLFGVISASKSLDGSSYRERAANLGIRVRW